ncbi:copia protein [Tanacetum coccineum]
MDIYSLSITSELKDIWGKLEDDLEGSVLKRMTGNLSYTMNLNTIPSKQRRQEERKPFKDNMLGGRKVVLGNVGGQTVEALLYPGQAKPIKCYNCKWTRAHRYENVLRAPKRLQDFSLLQDKMLLNASPGKWCKLQFSTGMKNSLCFCRRDSDTKLIDGMLCIDYDVDEGTSVNMMPKSLFEHLKLADLKETSMVVEMVDMTKKSPLGIVGSIPVKIDKFLFHFDFVVIDMLEGLNETMLLRRPFLATIHAQIDVFRREISLGIGEEKVKFDMNERICHSRVPVEKIYMASSVQESENFNPLKIKNDVFSYDSPTCLLLEQGTPSCSDESIDTVDSSDDMQELKGSQDDEVGSHLLENVVSRWHVCKPVRITFVDCEKDCRQWSTCDPDLRFCSGYDAIYGQEENGMLYVFEIIKDKMTRDDPYSRRFDVYKEEFDNEIEQLENEYELKAGRKRYALDEVWEKCEKFHDTTKL